MDYSTGLWIGYNGAATTFSGNLVSVDPTFTTGDAGINIVGGSLTLTGSNTYNGWNNSYTNNISGGTLHAVNTYSMPVFGNGYALGVNLTGGMLWLNVGGARASPIRTWAISWVGKSFPAERSPWIQPMATSSTPAGSLEGAYFEKLGPNTLSGGFGFIPTSTVVSQGTLNVSSQVWLDGVNPVVSVGPGANFTWTGHDNRISNGNPTSLTVNVSGGTAVIGGLDMNANSSPTAHATFIANISGGSMDLGGGMYLNTANTPGNGLISISVTAGASTQAAAAMAAPSASTPAARSIST